MRAASNLALIVVTPSTCQVWILTNNGHTQISISFVLPRGWNKHNISIPVLLPPHNPLVYPSPVPSQVYSDSPESFPDQASAGQAWGAGCEGHLRKWPDPPAKTSDGGASQIPHLSTHQEVIWTYSLFSVPTFLLVIRCFDGYWCTTILFWIFVGCF